MFQVDSVLWLQSLESPFLTWLMSTITWLGYTPVYASLLIVIFFGIDLKKGFYVFMAMLISGIAVDGMKRGLKFPRPSDVDSRVIQPGFERPPLLVENGGATDFWSLPSKDAMEAVAVQRDWSYGFPSGHVAAATAFLLALAFFFGSKRILVFSIVWILLMALSRMYLGRHFIADVLAGMTVGGLSVLIAIILFKPITEANNQNTSLKPLLPWAIFILPLVLFVPSVDIMDSENIGRLLGLLVTYGALVKLGFPNDKAVLWKRVARIAIAIALYVVIDKVLDSVMDNLEDTGNRLGLMLAVFAITFVSFLGTVLLAKQLKLYEPSKIES